MQRESETGALDGHHYTSLSASVFFFFLLINKSDKKAVSASCMKRKPGLPHTALKHRRALWLHTSLQGSMALPNV